MNIEVSEIYHINALISKVYSGAALTKIKAPV